jgi:hypothetical protein
MTTYLSSTAEKARVTAAIEGISKNFSSLATLNVAGVSYTPTSLIALLQAYADAITALQALHAQLTAAVLGNRGQQKQIQQVLLGLESFAKNFFGSTSEKLGDFGFMPKKEVVVTVPTKAAALAKSKATRVARHTMGKKQKAAITGSTPAAPTAASPAVTNGTTAKS